MLVSIIFTILAFALSGIFAGIDGMVSFIVAFICFGMVLFGSYKNLKNMISGTSNCCGKCNKDFGVKEKFGIGIHNLLGGIKIVGYIMVVCGLIALMEFKLLNIFAYIAGVLAGCIKSILYIKNKGDSLFS